ncbi:MAG: ribokinase [Lachnospiraceae bacterium]|mgnify:CR=1 FL=1|nr:ribokinase [uncultured Blautia sp.]MBS7210727.1 ribokinase [Lachnospiraceae bacterium]
MKKILVIGSLNLDMTTQVEHIPVVGETILSNNMEMNAGGKGANQACALGKLGADVTILGAVGNDMYADIQRDSLNAVGVNTDKIIVKENISTGIAWIAVNKEGDNSIIVVSGANADLSKQDIDNNLEVIKESDIVIFQLEVPVETVCYAAKIAKSFGKMVILDPAPVPKEFPEELYQYVDIIKPNETELGMLTGMRNPEEHLEKAVKWLKKKGIKDIIVTLGEKGIYMDCETSGVARIPAIKVPAVDTTAAGDSFIAAIAIMLAEGKSLREAVIFANYVSSIVVMRKGAQCSIPTLEEVMCYINSKGIV